MTIKKLEPTDKQIGDASALSAMTADKVNEIISFLESREENCFICHGPYQHLPSCPAQEAPKECDGKNCFGCEVHRGAMNVPYKSEPHQIDVASLLNELKTLYVTQGWAGESSENRDKRFEEIIDTLKANLK